MPTDRPPEALRWINEHFYDATPWTTLDRRVGLLAAAWAKPDELSELTREIKVDRLTIASFAKPDTDGHLGFVAAEAQVLLHQAAESLFRLLHAHQPRATDQTLPPCPAIELGRMRSFKAFRRWLVQSICEDHDRCKTIVAVVLGDPADAPPDRVGNIVELLMFCARFVLESAPYNAAKHGLALRGEHSTFRLDTTPPEGPAFNLIDVGGCAISWLDERQGAPAVMTRWYDLQSAFVLAHMVSRLIQQIWEIAYRRYVDDTHEPQYLRVSPLIDLLGPEGLSAMNLLTSAEHQGKQTTIGVPVAKFRGAPKQAHGD